MPEHHTTIAQAAETLVRWAEVRKHIERTWSDWAWLKRQEALRDREAEATFRASI